MTGPKRSAAFKSALMATHPLMIDNVALVRDSTFKLDS
jgi:hypothetical protein